MGRCISSKKEVEYTDKSIQVTIEKELSFDYLDKVIDEYLIEDDLIDDDIVYEKSVEYSNDFSISRFLNEIEEEILIDEQKKIDENSDIEMMSFYSGSGRTFDFLP